MKWFSVTSAPIVLSLIGTSLPGHTDEIPKTVVANASSSSSDTVLSGTITQAGRGVAGTVEVEVWPNKATLQNLPDGQQIKPLVLDPTKSSASGSFSISLSPGKVPQAYREADGSVTFEARIATADAEVPSWMFDLHVLGRRGQEIWSGETAAVETGASPAHGAVANVNFSRDQATISRSGEDVSQWAGDDGLTVVEASGATVLEQRPIVLRDPDPNATPPGNWACGGWSGTSSWENGRREKWVNSIGTIQGVPTVIQQTGSSHTLGTALKIGTGSWNGNGGTSVVTNTGAGSSVFRTYTGTVYNQTNWRRFTRWCFDPYGPGTRTDQRWMPMSVHSLSSYSTTISRPNWNQNRSWCADRVQKNGYAFKEQGSNQTFSSGVSLSVANVSSRASFTHNTKIQWSFNTTGALLCGNSNKGWVSSAQAGAFVP